MPGVSSRSPVDGMYGIGKVHLKFKPIPPKKSRIGFYIFLLIGVLFMYGMYWGNPGVRAAYLLPLTRFVIGLIYRSIHIHNGVIKIPTNISSNVTITRDENGASYIKSSTLYDTIFGQGYIHASDRFYQMDIARRQSQGDLSSLLGPKTVQTDHTAAVLGFKSLAMNDLKKLKSKEIEILQAYADGVNAYLNSNRDTLSLEYYLLGYKSSTSPIVIQEWQILDSLAIVRQMAWEESNGWEDDMSNFLTRKVTTAAATATSSSTSKPSNEKYKKSSSYIHPIDNIMPAAAGSSWSISDHKQKILGTDIHTKTNAVVGWYINSIDCPELHAVGASIPGIPLITVGHNQDIAWSYTASSVKSEQLYINNIKYKSDDATMIYANAACSADSDSMGRSNTCSINDNHVQINSITKPIRVAGMPSSSLLSIDAVVLDGRHTYNYIDAMYNMNKATNWKQFKHAADSLDTLPIQLMYTDSVGNIGYSYHKAARAKRTNVLMPLSSSSNTNIFIMDNNAVHNDRSNTFSSNHYQLLQQQQQQQQGMEDYQAIQSDTFSQSSIMLRDIIIDAIMKTQMNGNSSVSSADMLKIYDIISTYDGYYTRDAVAPVLLEYYRAIVAKFLLGPHYQVVTQSQYIPTYSKHRLYYKSNINWLLDIIIDSSEDSDIYRAHGGKAGFLVYTLNIAYNRCIELYGSSVSSWKWGKIHVTSFDPLPYTVFDKFFHFVMQRGPIVETVGTIDSIFLSSYTFSYSLADRRNMQLLNSYVSSVRFLMDMSQLDNTLYASASSQSGSIGSRYYDIFGKLLKRWSVGEIGLQLCWTDACIHNSKDTQLILTSSSSSK